MLLIFIFLPPNEHIDIVVYVGIQQVIGTNAVMDYSLSTFIKQKIIKLYFIIILLESFLYNTHLHNNMYIVRTSLCASASY